MTSATLLNTTQHSDVLLSMDGSPHVHDLDSDGVDLHVPDRTDVELYVSALVLLAIICFTVIGNTAVIYAVCSSKTLRSSNSNWFIINLSITDFSSAVFVMTPALFILLFDFKQVPAVLCNFCCTANYCLIIVSMLTLAFISIERYVAIVHPLSHVTSQIITNKRVVTMVTYPWMQGMAFGIAPVILGWVHYDYWEAVCAIDWFYQKQQAVYYVLVAFTLCFVFPGVVMLYCYMYILRTVQKRKTTMARFSIVSGGPDDNKNHSAAQRLAKRTKTVRTLLVVVLMFFVCMTPFCVTKLLKVVSRDSAIVPPYINLLASYFGYMSSVVNPFIYAVFRPEFRRAYKRLWQKIPCFKNNEHGKRNATMNHSTSSV